MLTIAETSEVSTLWPDYWTADEFGDFCAWLALRPEAGDVVPRSGGCRKGALDNGRHREERVGCE